MCQHGFRSPDAGFQRGGTEYTSLSLYVCMYIYISISISLSLYIYICMYIYMYVYTYIYIYIYIYMGVLLYREFAKGGLVKGGLAIRHVFKMHMKNGA